MATKKDKLASFAEHLYINEGYTLKAIAEHLDITEKTVGKWCREGKWEDKKAIAVAAPHTIKLLLLQELKKVANGEKTNIDSDALSKISKVIESMDDKVSIQVIMTVFKEFDLWLVDEDPDLALKCVEYHKKYLLHKINLDG